MRVVIVGGGIMGLATAWALMREGHAAVVLEQGPLPNLKGASADHHRLIRYAYGSAHGYALMVRDAYAAWERLWVDLGRRLYEPTGQLLIGPPADPWVSGSLGSFERLEIAWETLAERDIERRFPMLEPEATGHAVWTPTGGVLLAARITGALAGYLRERGVELREGTPVREIDTERAAARLATGEQVTGDALLVAAGPWVGRLVPSFATRIRPSRQVVAYVEPPASLAAAWRSAPMITDVLASDASVFYAVPGVRGTPLKLGDHRFSLDGDPDDDREAQPEEAAAIMQLAGRRLRAIEGYRVRSAAACFYDVAPGERFVAEQAGRALTIGGFSGHGFKFGALVGERTADVLTGAARFAGFKTWLAAAL